MFLFPWLHEPLSFPGSRPLFALLAVVPLSKHSLARLLLLVSATALDGVRLLLSLVAAALLLLIASGGLLVANFLTALPATTEVSGSLGDDVETALGQVVAQATRRPTKKA